MASRPFMPGYGVLGAGEGEGLLPWSWAEERLVASRAYWVVTVRPDGAPHAMPVWGVWHDGRMCFSTGDESRKARNLAAEPRCTVTTASTDEPVIVEGVAEPVAAGAAAAVVRRYRAKYGPTPVGSPGSPLYAVRPSVVFALVEHEDRFAATPTRWVFPAF